MGPAKYIALDLTLTARFSMACLVSALERLHEALVVFRALQPESIFVDVRGRLVLMDYRVCKVTLTS